jgi:hypothetical protein
MAHWHDLPDSGGEYTFLSRTRAGWYLPQEPRLEGDEQRKPQEHEPETDDAKDHR